MNESCIVETPVWFLRQAGRCFPEYRKMREAYSILEISKCPEMAAEVSLMPVEQLDVDFCSMYSDLLLPLDELGLSAKVSSSSGPLIDNPVRSEKDILEIKARISDIDMTYINHHANVLERSLKSKVPIVGLIGGIYTLAAFAITGRPARDFKNQVEAKSVMFSDSSLWNSTCEVCFVAVKKVIDELVRASVKYILIFDSWVGSLSPYDHSYSVFNWNKRLIEYARQNSIKTIYFGTGTAHLAPQFLAYSPDILSLDWRADMSGLMKKNPDQVFQGNLDPERLLLDWNTAKAGIDFTLNEVQDFDKYVFSLGHGVIHETELQTLRGVVRYVKEKSYDLQMRNRKFGS